MEKADNDQGPVFIPYGHQSIDHADIEAVVRTLKSEWLTTGPAVSLFEERFASNVDARHAVAVSSGTAALHTLMYGLGVKPGDEVIVPSMTFAATANAVVYQGGTPVFADVEAATLLIDPDSVQSLITSKTRAIVAVDYAGQACNYSALRQLASAHCLALVSDGCHALGAHYQGKPVGSVADATAFSFHPVKHITTGEGGMITTNDAELARRMQIFRNHGITTDHRQRSNTGQWHYEMVTLGYNYRLSDIQCALGLSQLKHLPDWLERRRDIARRYDIAFNAGRAAIPLAKMAESSHAYHLYVVKTPERDRAYRQLRERGIGVNVHYMPVHLHPFYRETFNTYRGQCPVAESASSEILSLPMYPAMSDEDIRRVIEAVDSLNPC
jgi:UDP-4-amino-4,6-dideoxy-N-acetyl-beta-L-altrosamine transaminase